MSGFAKRGLRCTLINIEKSYFEILVAVYLENAWCLIYAILHQSVVMQYNSNGVCFNGLLAKLFTILVSFLTSITSDYIGVVSGEPQSGKKTCIVYFIGPMVLEMAQKVVKSVDNTDFDYNSLTSGILQII